MNWALVVGIVAGLLALDLLVHLVFALIILPIFERKPPFGVEQFPPDAQAEPVAIPTTHGLTLRGSLYRRAERPSRGLVLFCPELGGTRWSAMSYCGALWEAGFSILAFDFRSQGESDRMPGYNPLHWPTEYEVSDVLAAIGYIGRREDLRELPLGLFGISRGGCAALVAATGCPEARCVAAEGVFSTDALLLHFTLRWATLYAPVWLLKPIPLWHFRTTLRLTRLLSQLHRRCRYVVLERWLPRLRDRPVLWVADEEDSYVPAETSEMLYRQIGGEKGEFWLVPAARHNKGRQADPDGYDRRLVRFFSDSAAVDPGELSERMRTGEAP